MQETAFPAVKRPSIDAIRVWLMNALLTGSSLQLLKSDFDQRLKKTPSEISSKGEKNDGSLRDFRDHRLRDGNDLERAAGGIS